MNSTEKGHQRNAQILAPATNTADPAWKGVYKAGGIALILVAVVFLIAFYPSSISGGNPTTAEELLSTAQERLTFSLVNLLGILLELLLIPGGLAIYLALKDIRKTAILIGVSLWELFVVLDIIRLSVAYSVISLSNGYAAATSETQRDAYVAVSNLAFGFSFGVAYTVVDTLFFASALVIGLVMLKGIFSKWIAYLGIATGIVGLVGSPYSPAFFPISSLLVPLLFGYVLSIIWALPLGYKLYKLGSSSA